MKLTSTVLRVLTPEIKKGIFNKINYYGFIKTKQKKHKSLIQNK